MSTSFQAKKIVKKVAIIRRKKRIHSEVLKHAALKPLWSYLSTIFYRWLSRSALSSWVLAEILLDCLSASDFYDDSLRLCWLLVFDLYYLLCKMRLWLSISVRLRKKVAEVEGSRQPWGQLARISPFLIALKTIPLSVNASLIEVSPFDWSGSAWQFGHLLPFSNKSSM